MRPFPQVATGAVNLADQWTAYRKAMIDYAASPLPLWQQARRQGKRGFVERHETGV